MENRFYKDDFDDLVKTSADQYRMFPSEKVWKGINNRLHTRRRWYGAGLAFLLLSIGTVTWVMFTNRPSDKSIANYKVSVNRTTKQNNTNTSNIKEQSVFIAPKAVNKNQSNTNVVNTLSTVIQGTNLSQNVPTNNVNIESGLSNSSDFIDGNEKNEKETVVTLSNEEVLAEQSNAINQRTENKPEAGNNRKASVKIAFVNKSADANKGPSLAKNNLITTIIETIKDDIPKNQHAEHGDKIKTETTVSPITTKQVISSDISAYGIESVSNTYIKLAKRKKATWQIYFTPSVTYRSLRENQAFIKAARLAANPINQTSPSPSAFTYSLADLEHVVTHKADLGFQLGASVSHPLSRKLRLVTGFQFNVNKYDIKAYGHTTEVATISLNTLGRRSSVSTVTSYRVIGSGYNVNWLRNFYFSASVPMGLEYVVVRGKRSYVGVAANVQPTYVLDNKSYLVSTDYKNYAQVPSLTRHWNINTGAEIFAGIVNKKSEWRISPQVRYQTLSSYKNTYPVKENLFDVGVKLGLILK